MARQNVIRSLKKVILALASVSRVTEKVTRRIWGDCHPWRAHLLGLQPLAHARDSFLFMCEACVILCQVGSCEIHGNRGSMLWYVVGRR